MRTEIRELRTADRAWARALLEDQWGSPAVVRKGRLDRADLLPGLVAELAEDRVGLLTYQVREGACEIVTLNSLKKGAGIGTALLEAVRKVAREAGCRRLWLITTNDNLEALRFYQKRGFKLRAIYCDAVTASRKLKPEIPRIGRSGIPIRDEIELEARL